MKTRIAIAGLLVLSACGLATRSATKSLWSGNGISLRTPIKVMVKKAVSTSVLSALFIDTGSSGRDSAEVDSGSCENTTTADSTSIKCVGKYFTLTIGNKEANPLSAKLADFRQNILFAMSCTKPIQPTQSSDDQTLFECVQVLPAPNSL